MTKFEDALAELSDIIEEFAIAHQELTPQEIHDILDIIAGDYA